MNNSMGSEIYVLLNRKKFLKKIENLNSYEIDDFLYFLTFLKEIFDFKPSTILEEYTGYYMKCFENFEEFEDFIKFYVKFILEDEMIEEKEKLESDILKDFFSLTIEKWVTEAALSIVEINVLKEEFIPFCIVDGYYYQENKEKFKDYIPVSDALKIFLNTFSKK
jgi:hypothetical protein